MKYDLDFFRSSSWNPMKDLFSLQREINRLFEGQIFDKTFSTNHSQLSDMTFSPACDVEETDSQYMMSFELPGVPKEKVKLELHDRQLVVSGEKTEERKENSKTRHVSERYHGSFKRVFTLPSTVNAEKVEALYENGVLKITLPKVQAVQPKQIKITEPQSSSTSPKEPINPQKNGQSPSRVA